MVILNPTQNIIHKKTTDVESSIYKPKLLFVGKKSEEERKISCEQYEEKYETNHTKYMNWLKPGLQADLPLRIIIRSNMIGAIIGRQGDKIRTITMESRTRVHIHSENNIGLTEKAITIYGNPKNCTNACKMILELIQQKENLSNTDETSLKILGYANLVSRMIGKNGNTIKQFMKKTETNISINPLIDLTGFNLECIITVKGSIENISKAEYKISSNMRQSYENDLQAMTMLSALGTGMIFFAGLSYGRSDCPFAKAPTSGFPSDLQATTFVYIPNNAVGSILGSKGTHIRNIMKFSGASVKIEPIDPVENEKQTERKITIFGTAIGRWKAQYMIWEKLRKDGFLCGPDDTLLNQADSSLHFTSRGL